MKVRHNQILAGLLVVQVVLIVIIFWPRAATSRAGKPLFPGLKSSDVVTLTIADKDGNSVTLRQVAGAWVLPDVDNYPTQETKVATLLEQIAALNDKRVVTRTAASHKQLKVAADDFVRRIDLEKADGTRYRFYLGSSPSYSTTHLRVDGQDETYLVSGMNTQEILATAISWVDPVYFSVSADQVTALTLQNANGTYTLIKDDQGKWTLVGLQPGETLDETKVSGLVQRATSVRMLRPLGKEKKPEYGLDQPDAVVTLTTTDKVITLTVGAQDPTSMNHVVSSSQSPYYALVSEAVVEDMVQKNRQGFLVVPATPTPTKTP